MLIRRKAQTAQSTAAPALGASASVERAALAPGATLPEGSTARPGQSPRRILSVCEDLDGALRVGGHLSKLSGPIERQDLSAAEAIERLRDPLAPPADLVLFAPGTRGEILRPVAQELAELAVHRAGGLVVLLAAGQSHGLTLAPSAEVITLDALPAKREPVKKTGLLARLFNRPAARTPEPEAEPVPAASSVPLRLITFQGLAGGAGGTTLASLLAAEIAATNPELRVLLIDLDLQFGQIGAYLDLREDGRITDLYSGFSKLDVEAFRACLRPVGERLSLLTAPPEILPLDALDPRKMLKFLNLARQSADVVILDLPHALPDWLDPIWREADLMIWVAEPGIRSSHAFRRMKALTEGLAFDPRRSEVWLNRVPPRPKREEAEHLESLRRAFGKLNVELLPEGGDAIRYVQIQGSSPLEAAAGSALVHGVRKQAQRLSPRLKPAAQAARNAAQ